MRGLALFTAFLAVSIPFLLAVASPLAVLWGAYTVHWSPAVLVPVTWNRFLIQGALPLFLLLALSLRPLLRFRMKTR
jgi:hypothetical protein